MQKHFVRKAVPSDLVEIVALCEKHAAFENAAFNKEGKVAKLGHHLFRPTPEVICIVAEYNEIIIGYATFMKQFSTWEASYYLYLDCLYLESDFRGMGIGHEIMNYIHDYSVTQNLGHLEWQTPLFNEQAVKFYKQLGASAQSKNRFFWKTKNL